MQMLSYTSRFFEEAYKIINKVYFNDELPMAMITLQSSPGSFAYITTKKIWIDDENQYYEINISTEYLMRDTSELLASLCHEMVHCWCLTRGIRDTSRGSTYHNKRFRDEAEKRGLIITYVNKAIGYSDTKPSEEFIGAMKEYGLLDTKINHFRMIPQHTDSSSTSKPKKKSSTRKYVCSNPSCSVTVRATRDVNIICADCNMPMVKVDT